MLNLKFYSTGVRIPPYEKENKASSGAEDDAKSVEVGTCEVGLPEQLKWRIKLHASGKILDNKG